MDQALAALYDADAEPGATRRSGGLGSSAPRVARWLGDIRTYFPTSVVQVMQRDAIDRRDLTTMLLHSGAKRRGQTGNVIARAASHWIRFVCYSASFGNRLNSPPGR